MQSVAAVTLLNHTTSRLCESPTRFLQSKLSRRPNQHSLPWEYSYKPQQRQKQKHNSLTSGRRRGRRFMTMAAPEHIPGEWFSVPELSLRDHRFNVPLDYSSPSTLISVFAREVVAVGKEEEQQMPYLLFLQGGPGFESPRPTESSGWIKKASEDYRLILLDQSYGGFCAVTYLSFAPQGLKQVLLTGGTPPLKRGCTADSVYKLGYEQVSLQNEKYYERYPQDIEVVREIVNYLESSEGGGVPLPSGGILTPRGLQLIGLSGLGSSTGFERLHYMFERAWDPILVPGAKKSISCYFLKAYENWLGYDTNPLFAVMHESIYCQGASSRWSAHRIRAEQESKFDAIKAAKEGRPILFTGEMMFPWMFDEIHALRPFKDAAYLLAEEEDWPPLYDIATLNSNQVPVAAAVYYEDMYVNFKLAMETTSEIAGIRLWITNEYMHSGLRDDGAKVLDHLLGMLNGKKPLF